MKVLFYIIDMVFPVLTGILFLSYIVLYKMWKEKSCFWIAMFFLIHTVSRLTDNIISHLPGTASDYEIYSDTWWLITRVLLSLFYYKIIVSKSGIEVPGREAAMLVSFGVVIFILAFFPETKGIYFTFLCYVLIWGVIRLYPQRRTSRTMLRLFVVILLLLVVQFTDLVLSVIFRINVSQLCMMLFELIYLAAAVLNLVTLIKNRLGKTEQKPAEIDPVDILSAEYNLTARESEIISLLLSGYTAKEISDKLFISEGTAKVHIHNIYQKLGINRRAQINVKIEELLKIR